MKPFEHILVPTDFGEPAERALDLAIMLASRLGSKLTLLHASWLPPTAFASAEGLYWPVEQMLKDAEVDLAAALASAKSRLAATTGMLITGEPAATIVTTAKQRGCDLIVMGTHGRRGFSRLVLGSVAEKVLRASPAPVLTMNASIELPAERAATSPTSDAGALSSKG